MPKKQLLQKERHLFYLGKTSSSVYIFGGQSIYNPNVFVDGVSFWNISKDGILIDRKSYFTQMPEPRSDHCSVGYTGNIVFIIGGQTTGSTMMLESLLYNLKSSTFVKVFSLSRSRLNPTCNIVGEKIVIAGGMTKNG